MPVILTEESQHNGASTSAPCCVLLADIGGSKSRFALLGPAGQPERLFLIDNGSVPNLEGAIAKYLEATAARPKGATIAVAGPVAGGDEIALTNRRWTFRRSDLAKRFGFSRVEVINDFEAIAWGLLQLGSDDVRPLGSHRSPPRGVKIALGPGTGLGVAALIPTGDGWFVMASEGGHASFGAREQDEVQVFRALLREHSLLSAESILSGPGLVRLMRALVPGPSRTPEQIIALALAGESSARVAVDTFVRLLGRFAGDMALTFKSIGGVYLTGGVVCGLGSLLAEVPFRAAFEAHPPHQKMLADIPTSIITCPEPGLMGCAALAGLSAQKSCVS